MEMKEVVNNIIIDTVNERLDLAKHNIISAIDSIINRASICSMTDKDSDMRVLYMIQKRTAESLKEIVDREINNAKATPTHPSRR